MKKNNLNISNLISIGVYSAVYFLFVTIATFSSAILIPAYGMICIPAIAALISSLPYYLLGLKVQKFGAITLMGFTMGIFYFVSGHFPLSFIPAFLFSILADGILYLGKYKSKLLFALSYILFCFGNAGPILPLFFSKEAYISNLVERGKDNQYIANLFTQISSTSFVIMIVSTIIFAIIGSVFAHKMMKKHFKKAGII